MNVIPSHSRPKLLLAAALFSVTLAGCHKNQPTVTDATNTGDPAEANLAASDGSVPDSSGNAQQPLSNAPQAAPAPTRRVLGARAQNESQQQAEDYTPQQGYTDNGQGAPVERRAPEYTDGYNQQNADTYDQGYNTGMDAVEEADQPPPPLPVYEQPPCPEPNYLWTPGYWNYAPAGYYWVPGAWIAPPYSGALWTPGSWGYGGNRYRFHSGFWGPHIGFYGGVAYGFGYTGYGYQGGYWNGNNFQYNRAVNRVDETRITNVYNRTVIINNNTIINRVSYNGGNGGIQAQPRPAELAALRETRVPPMASQVQLRQTAATNRQQFFSANQGRPATVVSARPLAATPGIAPPAVRLPSANAPRPAATPGRSNLPQQQAAQQRGTPQQPGNQQRLNTPQQAARPAEAGRATPQQQVGQQRLNTQQPANQQHINPQQPAQQQRANVQQPAQQQRGNTPQQAQQQRANAQQQAQQQRANAPQQAQQQRANAQQQANQQRVNAQQQAAQQRPTQTQPQARPEMQERAQPSRTVTPQAAPRPAQPTARPTQPAPRPETAAPRQQAPREEARPAEGRPH